MKSRNNMHRCRQCEEWMESRLRVYDRFGVFLLFLFSNVKIDCIKEMGKL